MSDLHETQRGGIYSLLSRLYRQEVDSSVMTQLQGWTLPPCANQQMERGYAQIQQWLTANAPQDLEAVAVDYASIFLTAGSSEGKGAFPYESVYTSPQGLIKQEAWEQVKVLYYISGVTFQGQESDIMEDHISSEFAFMAYLCYSGIKDCQQRAFFDTHIMNWAPTFCQDVLQYAKTPLYQGLATFTLGWLALEQGV